MGYTLAYGILCLSSDCSWETLLFGNEVFRGFLRCYPKWPSQFYLRLKIDVQTVRDFSYLHHDNFYAKKM